MQQKRPSMKTRLGLRRRKTSVCISAGGEGERDAGWGRVCVFLQKLGRKGDSRRLSLAHCDLTATDLLELGAQPPLLASTPSCPPFLSPQQIRAASARGFSLLSAVTLLEPRPTSAGQHLPASCSINNYLLFPNSDAPGARPPAGGAGRVLE